MPMKKKVLIATPCYGNCITNGYFLSMLSTMGAFSRSPDVEIYVYTHGNESLITRARNVCVAHFLKGDYTHLMFIDSDIQFEPAAIQRMLDKNEDVVCGVYPQKTIDWEKLRGVPDLNVIKDMTTEELQARMLKYNVHVSDEDGFYSRAVSSDGFIEVARAATGFMLIKRTVFTRMMKKYPELRYESDDVSEKPIEDHLWLFFDCMLDKRRKYLSEDYAFCQRWRDMGGRIYVDLMTPLTHIGSYSFRGHVVHSLNFGVRPPIADPKTQASEGSVETLD